MLDAVLNGRDILGRGSPLGGVRLAVAGGDTTKTSVEPSTALFAAGPMQASTCGAWHSPPVIVPHFGPAHPRPGLRRKRSDRLAHGRGSGIGACNSMVQDLGPAPAGHFFLG
jgi:hypothetical protein